MRSSTQWHSLYSDGRETTQEDSLVIDRKARHWECERMKEKSRIRKKESKEPVSVSIIPNGLLARQDVVEGEYFCTSVPLRSLLICRLSAEINKSLKKETRVITPVIVFYRLLCLSSYFTSYLMRQ